MKFREFITALIFLVLLMLLLYIVDARATWEDREQPAPTQTMPVEEPAEPEPSKEPKPSEAPYTTRCISRKMTLRKLLRCYGARHEGVHETIK